METKTKNSKVCLACSCPCEKHKKHTHGMDVSRKSEANKAAETCKVCGLNDENCKCN